MKKIYAGLIGFGNIGTGVVRLLDMNRGLIEDRLGASIVLKKIADIDIETPRDAAVDRSILTADAADILKDPEISIVIELVGGYQPALSFMLEAIKAKKTRRYGEQGAPGDLRRRGIPGRRKGRRRHRLRASVGGTIPVIKTLKECLVANRIKSVLGIMNGTSNYILTKMSDEGQAFAEVLKEAPALGFAEADPTFDIEGIDTAHKLAIVLSLSYGKKVEIDSICREGISGIAQKDIEFAKELGYKIKLLAIAAKEVRRSRRGSTPR